MRVLDALKNKIHKLSPVEAFSLSFVISLYAPDLCHAIALLILFILPCLILFIWTLFKQQKQEAIFAGMILLGLLGGFGLRYHETNEASEKFLAFKGLVNTSSQSIVWTGRIESFVEKYPDRIKFTARVEKIFKEDDQKSSVLIHVFIKDPSRRWSYGEVFTVRSQIKENREFRNPGPPFFSDLKRLQSWKGIWGYTFIDDSKNVISVEKPHYVFTRFLQYMDLMRQNFSDYVDISIPYPESAFLKAITVGYRGFIDDDWNELITRAGVQHILAISGLHLGMVAFFIFYVFRIFLRFAVPRCFLVIPEPVLSAVLSLPFVFLYSILAGFTAPTKRTFLSILILSLGVVSLRNIPFLAIFSAGAAIILINDLSLLYSPSFVLSFAAISGIKWVALDLGNRNSSKISDDREAKPKKRLLKIVEWIWKIFWISFCVQVVLCPFLIYFFFRFCWAGLISNVIAVPYVSFVVLPVSLIFLVGFFIDPTISDIFSNTVKILIGSLLSFIKFFGNWSESVFWGIPRTQSPVLAKFYILIYITALGFVVGYLKRKKLNIAIVTSILLAFPVGYQFLIVFSEPRSGKYLEVVVMDVGDGNSTFIKFPDGKTVLIDGGGVLNSRFNIGMRIIAPAVMALGFRHIDDIILSHYHHDHVAGLYFLVKSFPVSRFVEPLCDPEDKALDLRQLSIKRGLRVVSFEHAQKGLYTGEDKDLSFTIIHPDTGEMHYCKNTNDSSTVFILRYFDTTLIIPSDIGKNVLRKIFPKISRKKNEILILMAPHHGRCGSFDRELFDQISPNAVVISSRESRNVPCPDLIQWCMTKEVSCFETYKYGAIKLESNCKTWSIYRTDQEGVFRFLTHIGQQ